MKYFLPKILIVLFVIAASCKKDDPTPLGAQVNAKLLAGDAGKSKSWKVVTIGYASGSTSTNLQLNSCFTDNVYTFSNNAAQDYQAFEGSTKPGTTSCVAASNESIEKGTWAFTLDGIIINIGVDEISSYNGLFSPDAIVGAIDSTTNEPYGYTVTYPYPGTVVKLTADAMILEMNNLYGTTATKYTLTFIAQ